MSINGYLDSILAGYPIYCLTVISPELHISLQFTLEPFLVLLAMRKDCISPVVHPSGSTPMPAPKAVPKKPSTDHWKITLPTLGRKKLWQIFFPHFTKIQDQILLYISQQSFLKWLRSESGWRKQVAGRSHIQCSWVPPAGLGTAAY